MALSAARTQKFYTGDEHEFLMGTDVCYQGGMVMQTAGLAIAAADTASSTFLGVAKETVDNSAGATDKKIALYRTGVFSFVCVAATTATLVGLKVYATDDQTVRLTGDTSNQMYVGVCVGVVSATEVLVQIDTLSSD